jgi:hypothetical protein
VFYNEIQYYNWSNPGYASNYGHFTQVVWASTGFLGVGVTIAEKLISGFNYSCAFVVMNYYVAGNLNYVSSFNANVLPLKN